MEITRFDVAVAGGSLAVYRFDGGAAPDAPVVLAAHGITGNSHGWQAVARELAGRAVLVAPDLRGRGESRAVGGPFGAAAHAADLIAVADHLALERPVCAGHSLGAYIVARLAADHPDRIGTAILVDGGLLIPGSDRAEPQAFVRGFLGPALARLRERYASLEAYLEFWRAHPAFGGGSIGAEDLEAFAGHDLIGEAPELRSSVSEEAVEGDAGDLPTAHHAAHAMTSPAVLLHAARGLLDQPEPMVPAATAEAWAHEAPDRRRAVPVAGTNHYSIALGRGAPAVAAEIAAAVGV